MKRFRLISLFIVALIVAIFLVAVTVPTIMWVRAERGGKEKAAAVTDLRFIFSAVEAFHAKENRYPAGLEELIHASPLVFEGWDQPKNGYRLTLTRVGDGFLATAEPVTPGTVHKYFFVDQTGVLKASIENPADNKSPPIPNR